MHMRCGWLFRICSRIRMRTGLLVLEDKLKSTKMIVGPQFWSIFA